MLEFKRKTRQTSWKPQHGLEEGHGAEEDWPFESGKRSAGSSHRVKATELQEKNEKAQSVRERLSRL